MFLSFSLKIIDTFSVDIMTTRSSFSLPLHNDKHLGGDYGALSKLHVSQWQTSRWRLRGLVQTSCLTMANISVETTGLVQTSCLTMANISVETTGPCPNFMSNNGKHLDGDYGALSKLHVSQWQTSRWRLRGLVQTSCLTMANISVETTGPCPNFMSHNDKHLDGDYGALSKLHVSQWQTSRWRLRGLVQTSCLTMANISVETTGPCPNFMSHNGKHLGGDYGALSKLHVSQWQTSRWRLRGLVQTSCLTMANISVETTGPCPNFMSHNGKHLGGD